MRFMCPPVIVWFQSVRQGPMVRANLQGVQDGGVRGKGERQSESVWSFAPVPLRGTGVPD